MASVAQTTGLVEDIVRLRRAERVPSVADDVMPVRRGLESQVGPTLSRSRASQVLGVSQTALDRWIGVGEVPTVMTRDGRRQVPCQFVIELREQIDRLRCKGITRHPLAAALRERRTRAERLSLEQHGGELASRVPDDHRTAERRSLAYHEVVAKRLDDRLIAEARERVDRLAEEGHLHPRYAERWRQVLALSADRIAEAITAGDQDARDLRQNSPFAGALNEQERRRIIEAVR
jgi:DNA-binding transcriptional MerR regulator